MPERRCKISYLAKQIELFALERGGIKERGIKRRDMLIQPQTPAGLIEALADQMGIFSVALEALVEIRVIVTAPFKGADMVQNPCRPAGIIFLQPFTEQILDLVRQAHENKRRPPRSCLRTRAPDRSRFPEKTRISESYHI